MNSNIVGNYRQAYKVRFGSDPNLTDQVIWDIVQNTPTLPTSEEQDGEVLQSMHDLLVSGRVDIQGAGM